MSYTLIVSIKTEMRLSYGKKTVFPDGVRAGGSYFAETELALCHHYTAEQAKSGLRIIDGARRCNVTYMGFARCYNEFSLELKLSDDKNEYITAFSDFDIRKLYGGKKASAHALADTPYVTGKYDVSVRLRESKRNILLALSGKCVIMTDFLSCRK